MSNTEGWGLKRAVTVKEYPSRDRYISAHGLSINRERKKINKSGPGPSQPSVDRVHLAMYFAINCKTIIPAYGVFGISERTCFACDTVFRYFFQHLSGHPVIEPDVVSFIRHMNQDSVHEALLKVPLIHQPGTHGYADELWQFPTIPSEEKQKLLAGDKRGKAHLAQLEEWTSRLSKEVTEEITAEARRKLRAHEDVWSKSERISDAAERLRVHMLRSWEQELAKLCAQRPVRHSGGRKKDVL